MPENVGIAFIGDQESGPFDIPAELAAEMLRSPNPDGRSNSDVVRRWVNGMDITSRPSGTWIIDFGANMTEAEAALYEAPFAHVEKHVRPARHGSGSAKREPRWWIHVWPRPELRTLVSQLTRQIVTPRVSKHRLFVWQRPEVLADSATVVIARDDDFTLGVLHSRVHELWALGMGTQLETRPRYTPTTCFETFPFPAPTSEQRERVGEAARRLVELRDGWLNPPGLDPADLAKRTLTNLYNQRPTWLANAHADLDAVVFFAYGWRTDLPDTAILERLLGLNLERAGA